jgi:hypothetical protein
MTVTVRTYKRGWSRSGRATSTSDGVSSMSGSPHLEAHVLYAPLNEGAAAKAIQELAGHQSLSTTLRYMHLSPSARESAIQLLDGPTLGEGPQVGIRGDIVETGGAS